MNLQSFVRTRFSHLPYWAVSLLMALAAFGAYTSMYAFRKAFAASTFEGQQYLDIDLKVWLVVSQVFGYACSKFFGIRLISGLQPSRRVWTILLLIGVSWIALFFFAIVPPPLKILCLFINGLQLGMIWGLLFSYLEGRKATEFMAAVMSVTIIFASGFVKTVGRWMIEAFGVSELWMPFLVGLLFVLPIVFFVFILEFLPPPTAEDKLFRSERKPMDNADRKNFLRKFLPGIVITLFIYIMLIVLRDVRDNFEVEIWNELNVTDFKIYTRIDSLIAIAVLLALSLLILVKNNFQAFTMIHVMIIAGCLLAGASAWAFDHQYIGPVMWMSFSGLGLFLAYIPYNAVFFERMIATFRIKGNVGFVLYIADAAGYMGSVALMAFKEFNAAENLGWMQFFKSGQYIIASFGCIIVTISYFYFLQKKLKYNKSISNVQISLI